MMLRVVKRSGRRRKLLLASIGVAAVSYACERRSPEPVGNLVAPPPPPESAQPEPEPAPPEEPVGNLVAPPPPEDAGRDGA
jgi:hypothetical protein